MCLFLSKRSQLLQLIKRSLRQAEQIWISITGGLIIHWGRGAPRQRSVQSWCMRKVMYTSAKLGILIGSLNIMQIAARRRCWVETNLYMSQSSTESMHVLEESVCDHMSLWEMVLRKKGVLVWRGGLEKVWSVVKCLALKEKEIISSQVSNRILSFFYLP